MPQMAPISWLFLFLMFSVTFILMNIINYFNFFYTLEIKNEILKKNVKSLNWKW